MLAAAVFPAPIARITVAAPVTAFLSACKHAFPTGCRAFICADSAAFVRFQFICCFYDQLVRLCTDRHDKHNLHPVQGDPSMATGRRLLPEASGSPSSIFDAFQSCYIAILITDDFDRIAKQLKVDSFFDSMMDLFRTCRDLFHRPTIYDVYILCTLTFRTPCCIHGNVPPPTTAQFLLSEPEYRTQGDIPSSD